MEQLKAQVPGLVSITVTGDEYEALRADGQLVTEGNPDGGFVVLGVIVHRATDEATAALRQAEASIVAEKPKEEVLPQKAEAAEPRLFDIKGSADETFSQRLGQVLPTGVRMDADTTRHTLTADEVKPKSKK